DHEEDHATRLTSLCAAGAGGAAGNRREDLTLRGVRGVGWSSGPSRSSATGGQQGGADAMIDQGVV
ncbi:MAG TPA: hypothetical protein PKA51_11635, partial [Kiritimatiellia bacterium]|nr:hypothetical protein [Kiritimatiellia bacterium]